MTRLGINTNTLLLLVVGAVLLAGGPALGARARREEATTWETTSTFTQRITERAVDVLAEIDVQETTNLLSLNEDSLLGLFREWMDFHGKTYGGCPDEQQRRLQTFREHAEFISAHGISRSTYTVGLNALADLSPREFQSTLLGTHPDWERRGQLPLRAQVDDPSLAFTPGVVPENATVDWVEAGAVTPVKNQARCGSCWSFSTTGSIEGVNAIVSGKLVSLSEQELVDCDTKYDHGCNGGLMDYAFQFVEEHGLDTERDYPYQGVQGTCDTARENRIVVTIDGFEDISAGNEQAMVEAVSSQPVSVAIQANQQAFQLYTGGVFDDASCGTQLDHGVLVVGYGTSEDDQDFWLMKNSWGPLWGESGYMKMAMGVAPSGICGIAKMASFPVKKSVDPPPPPPTPTPPPKPEPKVVCNQYQQCAENTTCCCMIELIGKCLAYSCCPYDEAVCCDDHQHCCPGGTQCNTEAGVCEKPSNCGEGPTNSSVPMVAPKLADFYLPKIF